ncbi:2-pyrone-4,6-dicarboxylate hydrolase [Bradyrhizobium sp. SSBR45G]|uniref:amidohydrolase family protein n=1 Tax=unclassified Bradyrhizobium TaxID=2631580 RepID=UPI002342ABCE|nr:MULTISPECIES: amidohydrolase family protein [unclassified Bradyrhizobium]GLH75542.1 2-pyrone-4,6-dicarboxylate hydrolase [Bradyrhizobium sp. SSBR45G]GLH82671.1 2-pyrone-4,6-dicarboxylate hydrolase [Bradyrhizobium sp. SSBR45R]
MERSAHLSRRSLLLGTAALAALPRLGKSQTAAPVRWSAGTAPPARKAPPRATDCHFHTYDAGYPTAPGAALTPPDASPDDYKALQRRLGTTRGVLVTPSTYGTDNSLQLASMTALGADNFRMVAVFAEDVSDSELKRLDSLGARGVRFNLPFPGPLTMASLETLSPRLAALGWHCEINMRPQQLEAAQDLLKRLPSRIVIDHLGALPADGLNSTSYAIIRRLLDKGNTWVKLSGAYLNSRPPYAESAGITAAYVRAAPERMLWGSDWPHPTRKADDKPDDAELFDLMANAMPDQATLQRVLVDSPAELYGFAP